MSEGPGVNVAGRIGKTPRAVYNQETLKPGTETGLKEIGYQYTVSFNITSVPEERGTELFRSPDAVFYLSDPVSGKLGFARDGYLNTFNYQWRRKIDSFICKRTVEGRFEYPETFLQRRKRFHELCSYIGFPAGKGRKFQEYDY